MVIINVDITYIVKIFAINIYPKYQKYIIISVQKKNIAEKVCFNLTLNDIQHLFLLCIDYIILVISFYTNIFNIMNYKLCI